MKTRILLTALVALTLGVGNGGSLVEGASGGSPSPWIGGNSFYRPDLHISYHAMIDYGTYFALGFSVKNSGLSRSGAFKVTVVKPSGASDISYAGLEAFESRFLWLIVQKRSNPSGSPIFFAVDSYFEVTESNESNNLYTVIVP